MNQLMKRFLDDRSGNILIMTGLGFLFLVAVGGAGYDLGKQQLVKQRIQQASDAAAVAAAGMEFGATSAQRTQMAQTIYNLNFPDGYLGVARSDVVPNIVVTATDVTVSASTNIATAFVRNFNNGAGPATLATAGSSKTQIKVPPSPIDLILVMDNSGSMASTDVGLGNSLNAGGAIRAACVNGWIAYYALFGVPLTPLGADGLCNTWEGAVGLTRMNALRFSANDLVNTLLNPNPINHRIAMVTWDLFVIDSLGFTNTAPPLTSFLSLMYGRGATNSTQGLAQAETIAAGFRPGAVHAVILMTDGGNYMGGGPYPNPAVNASSLTLCNAFKTNGTLVYTIGFGAELSNASASSATARQFLSDCATAPNGAPVGSTYPNQNQTFFVAPNAAALNAAFAAILNNLKKVRILE